MKKNNNPIPIGNPRSLHKRIFGRAKVMQTFQPPRTQTTSDFLLFEVRKKSAIVLGLTADKEVISLRQFRYAQNKVMLELPGGYRQGNESLECCARREFLDETGYRPETVVPLGGMVLYEPSYIKGGYHPFLFLNCEKAQQQNLDDSDEIKVVLVPFRRWVKRVSCAEVRGGPMLTATLLALRHLSL